MEEKKTLPKIVSYQLPDPDKPRKFKLEIHGGAQLLNIDVRQGNPRIWAVADTSVEKVFRHFVCYGVNEEVAEKGPTYLGSYQLGGLHTYHIFEITP